MFDLLKKFKKVIIIIVLIIIAFFLYGKFGPKPSQTTSGLTVQTSTPGNSNSSYVDGPAREFVTQLLAIQNIRFNTSILTDSAYLSLQDFSRELIPQPTGRPNPFAPLSTADSEVGTASTDSSVFVNTSVKPAAKTTTKAASKVTPKIVTPPPVVDEVVPNVEVPVDEVAPVGQ